MYNVYSDSLWIFLLHVTIIWFILFYFLCSPMFVIFFVYLAPFIAFSHIILQSSRWARNLSLSQSMVAVLQSSSEHKNSTTVASPFHTFGLRLWMLIRKKKVKGADLSCAVFITFHEICDKTTKSYRVVHAKKIPRKRRKEEG